MEATLTDRQKETLVAYLETGTVDAAAVKLGISSRTTGETLRVVARKLGAAGIRDLVGPAVKAGLIKLEVAG